MKIKVTDPVGNTRKFALPEERDFRFVVGRATDCHVVLEGDASISRYHAFLEYREGYWYVVDNQSANGVQTGGRLVASAPLYAGRQIWLGQTMLEVLPEPAASVPAVAPVPAAVPPPAVPVPVAAPQPMELPPLSLPPVPQPDPFAGLPRFDDGEDTPAETSETQS